jgi:hypothetical protein
MRAWREAEGGATPRSGSRSRESVRRGCWRGAEDAVDGSSEVAGEEE